MCVCVCVCGEGAYLPVSSSLEKPETVGSCEIRKQKVTISCCTQGLALTILVSGVLLAFCTCMFTSCTCCRSMVGMGLQHANTP